MENKMNKEMSDALISWPVLNKVINNFDELQLMVMMDTEKSGKRRKDILLRLHQRYSKLRNVRERAELTGE
jgi:hypothetical protein